MRRAVKWILLSLAGIVGLAAVLVAVLLFVASLPTTRPWIRDQLVGLVVGLFGGDPVAIESIPVLEPTRITLQGVRVGGDEPKLQIESLSLHVSIQGWVPPRVQVQIEIDDPTLALARDEAGEWNVAHWGVASDTPADPDTPLLPAWLTQADVVLHDGRIAVAGVAPEPLRLSSVELQGRVRQDLLEDAIAEIDSLHAALGEASHLRARGTYELEGDEAIDLAIETDPLAPADLAGLAAVLRDEALVKADLRVTGNTASPDASFAIDVAGAKLSGAGRMEPIDDERSLVSADASFEGLDLTALLADGPPVRATGDASVRLEIGGPAPAIEEAKIHLASAEAFAVAIESATARALREAGSDVLKLEVQAAGPNQALAVNATGTYGLTPPQALSAEGTFAMHDPGALPPELRETFAGTTLDATFSAQVADTAAESPTGSLRVELAPGQLRNIPVKGAIVEAALEPDLLRVDRFWVGADRTDLEGFAWAQLGGDPAARWVGGRLRGPLSLSLVSTAYGVIDTDVTLWGRTEAVGLAAFVQSKGPVELPGAIGTFSGSLDAENVGESSGTAQVSVSGRFEPSASLAEVLGAEERSTKIELGWDRKRSGERTTDRVDLDFTYGADEPGSVSVRGGAESTGGTTRVTVDQLRLWPVVGPDWELVPPAQVAILPGRVDVERLMLTVGGGEVSAQGRLTGEKGGNDLGVEIRKIDLAALCDLFLAGADCGGNLEATLTVRGVAARPDITLALDVAGLRAAGQDYGAFRLDARTQGNALALSGGITGGPAGSARLEGQLPLEAGGRTPALAMDRPMTVSVRADELQIDFFETLAGDAVRRLDGSAAIAIDVRGTPSKPLLSGELRIADLVVTPTASGATFKDGRVHVVLQPDAVILDELVLDQGAITAGGTIALDAGVPKDVALWAALQEAKVVDRPDVTASATGRVDLDGAIEALKLEGELTIEPAVIRPTVAGGGAQEPDPTIQVVRRIGDSAPWISGVPPELGGEVTPLPTRPTAAPARAAGELPTMFQNLEMLVTVRLGQHVRVERYDANLRLNGEVYLSKKPADVLRINGGIDGRRGWYIFQGRRFEINFAYVTFSGEVPLDPYLNVEAQYRTNDYLVEIRVSGTAAHPILDLSSEPPLDESDILAVILFGKPASELNNAQGQVLQSQALALLASYVAPDLQRSVLDTFGLTSLTFSMPSGDSVGTVGVGRYFGDDLFVSVARDFGGPTGGTQRQLEGLVGSSVTIQYYLTPRLTLQGASSTEGESTVDLIWQRRY